MTPRAAATILIVDDLEPNRKLLELILQPEGYVTRCAVDGEEALRSIKEREPDLILLDVVMPGMDGFQVARRLKADATTSSIPIIMFTSQGDRSARLAGFDAGVEEFLTKPIDRSELLLRVRNLVRLKEFTDYFQNHNAILEQEVQDRTADLERFHSAMDATADAILLVDRATMRFIEVNATACAMLGYTRDELIVDIGPAGVSLRSLDELAGAYDLLIGGDTADEWSETHIRHKDGRLVPVEEHRHAQRSGDTWIIVAVLRDITKRKEVEERLHHLAHSDALTGLPNRTQFYDTLDKTLAHASEMGWTVAVLFIDLDHFKSVNDTLGHAIGDDLLGQVADRLVQSVRVRDTVGRLGGDEFALILLMQDGRRSAGAVIRKIRAVLEVPFDLGGRAVAVTASIGITVYPDDASDPPTLLKYADTAMYRAKQAGRDTFRFFTAEMNAEVQARLDLDAALLRAVENGEFVLHYQPKVELGSGRVAGLEALLRWHRPGHGLVSPMAFIPALEESGLIVQVGRWVIATACEQIGRWRRSEIGPMPVSVNVSGRQFLERDLDGDVAQALADNGVPADLLELELTESSLMANTERTITSLHTLRDRGVRISIDDFGTGYSSLAYLRRFPVDRLKIDIAFIRDITNNADDAAIALTIIHMAHCLNMDVVAEGVETAAQLSYLRQHHCDQIQGFYFSRSLPVDDLEQLLRDERRLPVSEIRSAHRTLLLVDDDAQVLLALRRHLQRDGYHILSARSAAEGFDLLALNPVEVILCDLHMPTVGGSDFLHRVRDLYPDTVRMVLSGYIDLDSVMDAINGGAIHRFLTKPWQEKDLRDNVRDAFRHHQRLHHMPSETHDLHQT